MVLDATMPAGTVLGHRYRIVRLIGHGGMGSVYEALQTDLGRRVAVKILDARLTFDPQHLERFRREAHAAAMLGHPNIVQVTDFQSNPNEPPFLVMDLLAGESLAQRLERQGRIDAKQAALVGVQVLDALAVAHRAGIVHRDIKPDNLFLVQMPAVGEIVKVLDFGVAKLSDASPSSSQPLTATGAMLGTPAYMAPEQARGNVVDHRADIYALGASLYHALAGTMPFIANSAPALLFAIVEQQPQPLAQLRPDLAPSLVAVIERAMQKDPARRFQSADEMRAALASIAQVSLPPSAVVVTPGVAIAPMSAYAATIGSSPPGAMTPGPTPQPLAPGVVVPSGVPLVMGQPQPTFGGVAQPTPYPPVAQKKGSSVGVVFLGIIGVLAVVGAITVGILYVLRPKPADAPVAATSASVTVAASAPAPPASSVATVASGTTTAIAQTQGADTTKHVNAPVASHAPTTTGAPAPAPTPTGTSGASKEGLPVDLNPVLGAAPTGGIQWGGKRMTGGGSDFGGCLACQVSDWRNAVSPGVTSCFAVAQFEPPVHEDTGYFIDVASTGQVTLVTRNPAFKAHPRLDACIAKAMMSVPFKMDKPVGGMGRVSWTAECAQLQHNMCGPQPGK